MSVIQVIFASWVSWPIYSAFGVLVGYWIWESKTEKSKKGSAPLAPSQDSAAVFTKHEN